jgi:hypothetical protein
MLSDRSADLSNYCVRSHKNRVTIKSRMVCWLYGCSLVVFLSVVSQQTLVMASAGIAWTESKHLSEWLHPFDTCLLQDNRNLTVIEITNDCLNKLEKEERKAKHKVNPLLPVRCRVGNTWPSRSEYCDSTDIPFSERLNLKSIVPAFDNPNDFVLRDFFHGLAHDSGLFLMIGDSVMQQFFGAIACELERENVWKDPSQFTNTDETRTIAFPDVKTVATAKFLPVYHLVNGRYDRVANAAMHSVEQVMLAALTNHKRIIVLVNMGLHYVDNPVKGFTKADYTEQVTTLLSYLNKVATDNTGKHQIEIIWRETTAQHFATPNGYWPGSKFSARLQFGCVPLQDSSAEADWRNRAVEAVVSQQQLQHVKILPFYNLTVSLWSEHPNGLLRDCTHFCWSPMMYQPIFHYLRSMMVSSSSPSSSLSQQQRHGSNKHLSKDDLPLISSLTRY